MLFNSYHFILFFPIVCLVYFVMPRRYQYLWLLATSYYFYMSWNAKYALLLLFSTAITYGSGLLIHRANQADVPAAVKTRRKKLYVGLSFGLNLLVLFFFKYFGFAWAGLRFGLGVFGVTLADAPFSLVLPVGISFYTFQALSYTMDVYRADIPAEPNFLRYALFVSFFPQLVAGPIERSKNLLWQVHQQHRFDFNRFREGLLLMLWGFFLKLVIADRAAILVNAVYNAPAAGSGTQYVLATFLFAVQIYCDFGGYSTIAMGAAKIMGFELMENFNAPYLAQSVAEFWRRWHISLSTWFRDYLYIPLGGNRKGVRRKYLNLLIVFAVSGLWHGASVTFLIWGVLNGLYQVVGAVLQPWRQRVLARLPLRADGAVLQVLRTLLTFALVCFSWVFFRANTLVQAGSILGALADLATHPLTFAPLSTLLTLGMDIPNLVLLGAAIALLAVADYAKLCGVVIRERILRLPFPLRALIFSGAIALILLVGIWGANYIASDFIYFQF